MVNERGFSLIEVIVAIGISAMVVLGTSSLFIDSAKVESEQERQFWIAARRIEFQGILRSPVGWTSLLANNPAMACLTNGTSCSGVSTLQTLKFPIDSIVLDGASNTIGMNNKGGFCNAFDSINGNSSCPVGIQLYWVALCDDANCLHAQPKFTIKFRVKEPSGSLKPLNSYDLVMFKDPKLESLNEVCTAMGGTLTGNTCTIASLSTACDPSNSLGAGATYPLGFDST
ncbi:MAG: type II secretion system protein [Bdellovibrionaceae bacterium]|nr:type II secretion system protein [Pseudobdellovibrionaceae bacterium]